MNNDINELSTFNHACDDFANSNFILFNIKLSNILDNIEKDQKLKDIISNYSENYDFKSIYKTMCAKNEIIMPTKNEDAVAFIFILLNKFKDNEINFFDFLSQYFDFDESTTSSQYIKFSNEIIKTFKNSANELYAEKYALVDSSQSQFGVYKKICSTVKTIQQNIDRYKLQSNQIEEFKMLLNSLFNFSENLDKNMVFTMLIAIDYFTKVNKKARLSYVALQDCFDD